MCGSHASLRSSVSSHPTYGPAKAVGRSQTRPVEVLGLPQSYSAKLRKMNAYIFDRSKGSKNQFYYASICYNETYD